MKQKKSIEEAVGLLKEEKDKVQARITELELQLY